MMTPIDVSLTPRRAWWLRVGLALLALVVLAGASFAVWEVSRGHQRQTPAPVRRIDWQHPVRIPGSGMALSGIGAPSTGDRLTPLAHAGTTAQAVAPQATFPGDSCYQGWAYHIWEPVSGGTGAWTDVWTNRGSTLEAWVQYLWCPRYAGDRGGVNFSYGRAYELAPGCQWIGVGKNGPWLGAQITDGVNFNEGDGENYNIYAICQGQYVWDYSLTVPGEFPYQVGMVAYDATTNMETIVRSPCCY